MQYYTCFVKKDTQEQGIKEMEQILALLKFIGYKPEGADTSEQAMRGIVWYIESIDNNSVSFIDEFITGEM